MRKRHWACWWKNHMFVPRVLSFATPPLQQVPRVCARTFISYSAPTSAKFPERISKRLLCKVRNTHGDELFGWSRVHGATLNANTGRTHVENGDEDGKREGRTYSRTRAGEERSRTRAHVHRMQRRRLYSSGRLLLLRNYVWNSSMLINPKKYG